MDTFTPDEVVRVLEKIGFIYQRPYGINKLYENSIGTIVTVPFDPRNKVEPKILNNILKDAGLTLEEFKKKLAEL